MRKTSELLSTVARNESQYKKMRSSAAVALAGSLLISGCAKDSEKMSVSVNHDNDGKFISSVSVPENYGPTCEQGETRWTTFVIKSSGQLMVDRVNVSNKDKSIVGQDDSATDLGRDGANYIYDVYGQNTSTVYEVHGQTAIGDTLEVKIPNVQCVDLTLE